VAVTLLTDAQQRAVDALAQAGRLEQVPVDLQRCALFLVQAAAALGDPPNVRHPQNTYNLPTTLSRRRLMPLLSFDINLEVCRHD